MKVPITLEQVRELLRRSKEANTVEHWIPLALDFMQATVAEVDRLHVIEQKYRRALFNQHRCEAKVESFSEDGKVWMRCDNKEKHPALDFSSDAIQTLEDEMAKLFLREQGVVIAGLNDDVTG